MPSAGGQSQEKVGFLVETADPEGNAIELLQAADLDDVTAAAAAAAAAGAAAVGVGAGRPALATARPRMGQLTLRVAHGALEQALRFYQDVFGWAHLCHVPLPSFSFDLHFLGSPRSSSRGPEVEDCSPDPVDLTALSNREWTYQRRYTTMELFSRCEQQQPLMSIDSQLPANPATNENWAGFSGYAVQCPAGQNLENLAARFAPGGGPPTIYRSSVFNMSRTALCEDSLGNTVQMVQLELNVSGPNTRTASL